MKTAKRVIGSVVFVIVLATCSSLDNIDVEASGQATIPMRTVLDELIGGISFLGFDGFDVSQSQEFQNQGYTKDQIDSVRVKSFTLSIVSPASANFDFLNRISFFAESPGLPRVQIASLDPIPTGSNELAIELLDVELAEYAAASSMTITTEANGNRPPDETVISADVVLDVDVNVTGACN